MGGSSSVEKFLALPLSKQREFPFTVNTRFCRGRETTISLADNFWGRVGASIPDNDDGSFTVREVSASASASGGSGGSGGSGSGRELFHVAASVPGAPANPKTKWLLDAYKIPVAHLKEVLTYTTAYNLHVGRIEEYYLTQIEVQYIPLHNNPCKAKLQNLDTGESHRIGVHGLWRQRTVFIYLDRGFTGGREAIAKVFRPDPRIKNWDFGESEYHVTIATGVDIAFIVLVCAAMDDALRQAIDAE